MNDRRIESRAWIAALVAAGLALAAAAPGHAALDPKFDPSKLTTPPLNPIKEVKPERSTLPNGMVLYLLEDHALPVVRGEAYVKTSPVWEPAAKSGLADVTGDVMRSGGSTARSGDWMDDRLAAIGASLTTYIGADNGGASFRCLSDNTAELLALLAEVMRRPAFPEDKIELAKVGQRRQIAARNDELFEVFNRTAGQAIYGKDSPYARQPEYATIEGITRDDCVKMHRQCFAPNRTILVVYGDFDGAAMKKLIAASFGDWARDETPLPPAPPAPARGNRRIVFAPKDDVTQSAVVLAHIGFRADSPDYADMEVLQQALGGGFSSRLFNHIRTQRGLAYATGAASGAGFMRPGIFVAYSLTRNDSAMTALDLLRDEVARITHETVTPEELKIARDAALNSFVFNFERASSVAFRAGFYELAGYPPDFLQRYQKALANVDAKSMLAAAQREIEPDKLITVIVGKEKEFDRPLSSLGLPLERVDISIPPPPSKSAIAPATPEALAKGQQWLKRAADLAGGTPAWAAIKTWGEDLKMNISIQGQSIAMDMSQSWMMPDRHLVVQKTPMGEMSQGYDGSAGWAKMMGKVSDNPKAAQNMKLEYERSLFHLFGHPGDLQVQALAEPQSIDGVSYSVAAVRSELVRDWKLFFAPDGRLARMEYSGEGPAGPGKESEAMSDWRAVGSIQYPYAIKVSMDDKPFMDVTVADAKVNPAFAADLFKKPTE
jgi:zinc protease